VGEDEGRVEGRDVGRLVGLDGTEVGDFEYFNGNSVGKETGRLVGGTEGTFVGDKLGDFDGGDIDGILVGELFGIFVGGAAGLIVGIQAGNLTGVSDGNFVGKVVGFEPTVTDGGKFDGLLNAFEGSLEGKRDGLLDGFLYDDNVGRYILTDGYAEGLDAPREICWKSSDENSSVNMQLFGIEYNLYVIFWSKL